MVVDVSHSSFGKHHRWSFWSKCIFSVKMTGKYFHRHSILHLVGIIRNHWFTHLVLDKCMALRRVRKIKRDKFPADSIWLAKSQWCHFRLKPSNGTTTDHTTHKVSCVAACVDLCFNRNWNNSRLDLRARVGRVRSTTPNPLSGLLL